MRLNKKNIFLLDGMGAMLSLLLTGLILPNFSDLLGLPPQVLFFLALFPFLYSLYSFGIYKFSKEIKPSYLLALIFANFFYCLISLFIILNLNSLTFWGVTLLICEILTIAIVIYLEYLVYKRFYD
jgi:hypothetical protein